MTVQEWLGENNTIGIDIWSRKYRQNNETFDEWLDRVSNGNKVLRQLIIEQKFLFGGRILASRGLEKTGKKFTLSNCFVISPPEDNIESIFDCAKAMARTYSYGGGCGIDISKLAPMGAKVNNTAEETSGSTSFMDFYSYVTGLIGQKGRRGALMISIDCHHPDIEHFITIKSDLDKVTKANISIRVTDDFMEAVVDNREFELSYTRKESNQTISKTINARDLFQQMCEQNWNYAEPGLLFWDTIENWTMLQYEDFNFAGVNPCVTGDTIINTADGEFPIRELVGKTPYIYCMDDDGIITIRQATKIWKTRENADLVEVRTGKGNLRCTPDHRIYTKNRGWVEAKDLKRGDKVVGLNRTMKDEKHLAVGLSGTKYIPEHRLVASAFYDISGKDVHHIDDDTFNNTISNLEVLSHGQHSAITNTGRTIEVQRDEKGRYVKKDIHKKRDTINQGKNAIVGTNWNVIEVITLDEKEDVYDMTVPEVHNFVANRIVIHNCAEEPLPAGGSCLLGSLNLSAFVENPFTSNAKINKDKFKEAVAAAVVGLNEVLDEGLPLLPLQEQRDSVRDWRQIGLGVMGYADMLIKLGIKFGSPDSLKIINEIGLCLINSATQASALLAKKDGTYPKFTPYIADSDFYKLNMTKETRDLVQNYGLRNSQLLTIAPTGTLSTMLGISGAIEPIFSEKIRRKTESLFGEDKYYEVHCPICQQYLDVTGEESFPDYFVYSHTIPVQDRIETQGLWQHYIDASISSTVNLPNDATVKDIEDLYILAWRKGLKGVTVYRDGCARGAVLTDASKTKQTNTNGILTNQLYRGDIIAVDNNVIGLKRKLQTGCGSLHVQAFFDPKTGLLLETYFSKGSSGGCERTLTGLSRMISLAARGGIAIEDIVDQLNSSGVCPAYAVRTATKKDTSPGSCCPTAIGRALLDMFDEVQNWIWDDKTNMLSTKMDGLATLAPTAKKCPRCGEQLQETGGCNVCPNCGWSHCD